MLVINTNDKKEVEYDLISIYKSFYVGVFIVKNIFTIVVFAVALKSAIQIGHPSFYKPAKWIQNV